MTFSREASLLYLAASGLGHVQLFAAPWTVASQAPLSMGFFRQEYWNRLSFPPPRDLSDPGIEPLFPAASALQADFFITEPSGKPLATFS